MSRFVRPIDTRVVHFSCDGALERLLRYVPASELRVGDTASGTLENGAAAIVRLASVDGDDTRWDVETRWTEREAIKRIDAADVVAVISARELFPRVD